MEKRSTPAETRPRRKIAPGEGERRAQRGLVPQYRIAAEKVLGLLSTGRLHSLGLADPEADTLDDLQTVRREGSRLILDAYQVKWSAPGEILTDGEFRTLLADLVRGRQTVAEAAHARAELGADPVDRVIAHLYTNRGPSTSRLGSGLEGQTLGAGGRSLYAFLEQVWHPAQRGAITDTGQVDACWHAYLEVLAETCGVEADALLTGAPDLRVEVGRELEEDSLDAQDSRTRDHLRDLVEIRVALQNLVSHRDRRWVWLTAEELVEQLGGEWRTRWRPRLAHDFPTADPYEPVSSSVQALADALERYDSGYVVLTGSPGAGKSTLLTRTLRTDDRRAASFYAYLPPEGESVIRGEASVFLHDLYLELAGRHGRRGLAPRDEAHETLRAAFREELEALGHRASQLGRPEIVLIDGLDHVSRDPKPHHPLLDELPSPEQVPDGVLFVLGTRSLADLPDHVRQGLEGSGRHVRLAPLERAAVLRLCAQVGLENVGERIAELSAGHPLLVRTYLAQAAELPAGRREETLAALAPSDGEIWTFYQNIWGQLAQQPETVELLGLISRLRGPIRLGWLAVTGTPGADLVRLDDLAYLFDTRDEQGWRFFHPSFREFLLHRTAERDGQHDPTLHRAAHRELAERCRRSPGDAPERFDELHHLLKAGEVPEVLERATVAYFRDQVDALRPRDEVRTDLRAVAGALAQRPDPMAAARLALAAHELQVRDYQFPENADLLELLVAIGMPEIAVANLRAIDNGSVGHDRRRVAMRLAQALANAGNVGEAMRVFEQHEPLEWLGGPGSLLRDPSSGHSAGLWAWSRAAAQLRGGAYVLEMIHRLRAPANLHPRDAPRPDELPAELLWSAADELIALGERDNVAPIRQALALCGDPATNLLAALDLSLALGLSDAERIGALEALDVGTLFDNDKVRLAEALADLGHADAAKVVLEQIRRVPPPEHAGDEGAKQAGWNAVYQYWRLNARLLGRPDAASVIPEPPNDHERPAALGARHLVTVAGIEGRVRAGESPASAELLGAVRAMHGFWDSCSVNHRWSASGAVGLASRRAVAVASALGPEALRGLLNYFIERWDRQPDALRFDGAEVISTFASHGAGPVTVGRALEQLEELMARDGADPNEWVKLGPAWLALDDSERAAEALRRAVRNTLSPSSDKDIQLTVWIRLLGPLLAGPDGAELGDRLVAALVELDRRGAGGAPDIAAQELLDVVSTRDLAETWRLGERLLDGAVLRTTQIIEALLNASADGPTEDWWIVAGELQVALGADPPGDALQRAAHADAALAASRLPWLVERVAVEGRPTERLAWRTAIQDAARAAGLPSQELGIDAEDRTAGDEAPGRQRQANAAPDDAVPAPQLLARAEDQELADHERDGAMREAVRRLEELDPEHVAKLEALACGTDSETALRVRLARRASVAGDPDTAWQQAFAALHTSSSGDWSRRWAGGQVFGAIEILQQLDRSRSRGETFRRFAELTSEVDHFLATIGGVLDDYVSALELPDVETAREVLGVTRALLRDIAPLPDPAALRPAVGKPSSGTEPSPVFEAVIVRLLGLEQTVAWEAAQRALLELRRLGLGGDALGAALSGPQETALRACGVVATRGHGPGPSDSTGAQLEALLHDERLDLRYIAATALTALGRSLPEARAPVELPAALRLELPPLGDRPAPVDPLERALMGWRDAIEALAALAGVDEDALHADVLRRAQAILPPGIDLGRTPSSDRTLGWGGLRPSARAILTALAEVAAVLCDAGLAGECGALRAADLYPPVDTALLARRPQRRPHAVRTFIEPDKRSALYRHTLEELAGNAASRVAREHDGWVVLGEISEISLLDRQGHHELRRGGLVRDDEAPLIPLSRSPLVTTAEYGELGRSAHPKQGIVQNPDPRAVNQGWLALHPGLAGELGLTLAELGGLDWLLSSRPAVHSLWWRSGFTRWDPNSEADEVGEGWLVLGSPELIARLRAAGWRRSWRVVTGRRSEDGEDVEEVQGEGHFALAGT